MKYPKLFEPGKIGSLEIANRMVMTAMEIDFGRIDGKVSRRQSDYFYERAIGGVGLIITGITRIDSVTGVGSPMQLSVADCGKIRALRKLTSRIHTTDTKIFCQIHHPGRQSYTALIGVWPLMAFFSKIPGFKKLFGPMVAFYNKWMSLTYEPSVVSASDVQCHHVGQKVRALKTKEVKKLVRKFVKGARRVKAAGFDGVEIHGAHGYLIQQFLSPRTNRRTDEYGGSFENRFRFLKEIITGVRKACGNDFPISVRLSVEEFYEDEVGDDRGITLSLGVQIAKAVADLGVDALNISSGTYETINTWLEPVTFKPGWRSYLAQAVKKEVSIPVIAANLIRSPQQAEEQLENGIQDFIGMGRPFLCDPYWVKKVKEGREEEIVSCIGCLHCFESLMTGAWKALPMQCARNPILGKEKEIRTQKANKNGKSAVVVGAGIAGLTAACRLAQRGFSVDVYEKEAAVGGQVLLAEKPDGKSVLGNCVREEERRCRSLGVRIHLNREITTEEIVSMQPSMVIVATGSRPAVPPIKGKELANCYTVDEILNEKKPLRRQAVVVVGSGLTGLETAAFLAERENRVTVVEMQDQIGPSAYIQNLEEVSKRLSKYQVELLTSCCVEEIKKDSVRLKLLKEGIYREKACDGVVLAVGNRSCRDLFESLKNVTGLQVSVVGDAVRPGKIADAVRSGYEAASCAQ